MPIMSSSICWLRLRQCALALSFALAFGARAETNDVGLHLVAYADGKTWRDFSVEKGEIVVPDAGGGGSVSLPANVRRRLDGDLKQNANLFRCSPNYRIDVLPPNDSSPVPRAFATIRISAASNSMGVCVWLVNGKPEIVMPVAPTPTAGRYYDAVQAMELGSGLMAGAPVVLLWSRGNFLAAPPQFSGRNEQHTLEMMHFGSLADLQEAIGGVKSVNARALGNKALLHFAAEMGRQSAEELLLKAGAKPDIETQIFFGRSIWPRQTGAGML